MQGENILCNTWGKSLQRHAETQNVAAQRESYLGRVQVGGGRVGSDDEGVYWLGNRLHLWVLHIYPCYVFLAAKNEK